MQVKYVFYTIFLIIIIVGSFLTGSWYKNQESPRNSLLGGNPSSAPKDMEDDEQLPPGTVRVTSEKQQMIGIRVTEVEKTSAQQVLRILGRVAADDTRVYRINMAVDGWITKTYDNSVGSLVKKGQTLATFYSPEFLSAQQAYIYSLSSLSRFQANSKRETRSAFTDRVQHSAIQRFLAQPRHGRSSD